MNEQQGTLLPNAVSLRLDRTHSAIPVHGAYLWPNGWVTGYTSKSRNQGRIFAPGVVREIVFGEAERDRRDDA